MYCILAGILSRKVTDLQPGTWLFQVAFLNTSFEKIHAMCEKHVKVQMLVFSLSYTHLL